MSSTGAAPRAAVPVSNERADASRKNGAKSRGPTTPEGKARAAQNALRHGLRAQKYVVLPEGDGAEFAAPEAALLEELAPVGALQTVLARRGAVAAAPRSRHSRPNFAEGRGMTANLLAVSRSRHPATRCSARPPAFRFGAATDSHPDM
jgi:hypothetical protein